MRIQFKLFDENWYKIVINAVNIWFNSVTAFHPHPQFNTRHLKSTYKFCLTTIPLKNKFLYLICLINSKKMLRVSLAPTPPHMTSYQKYIFSHLLPFKSIKYKYLRNYNKNQYFNVNIWWVEGNMEHNKEWDIAAVWTLIQWDIEGEGTELLKLLNILKFMNLMTSEGGTRRSIFFSWSTVK